MVKKLRGWTEKHLSGLVLLLMAVQPVLDVFSYFMGQWGRTAISTGLRFALLVAVALVGFLVTERKRLYLIFYGITAAFFVVHAANCFRIGYRAPVSDFGNYLRIMNFPIFTLSMITFFRRGEEVRRAAILGFAAAFGGVLLFTALPWALGQPVYTYRNLGIGVMGWFSVANAQSAIIVLVTPPAVYWAYRTKKYGIFLASVLLSCGLMFLTGTKFTFYSIFIITGAFAFLFVLQLKKRCLKYVAPLLGVAVLVFAFRNQSTMALRERMSDYHRGLYDNLVESTLENSGDEETVSLIRTGKAAAVKIDDDRIERIRRALIGVYTDPEVYGELFKDLYDRFGVYNVMQAYNYSAEPLQLSDSRVRKRTFTQLMWKEKDLATRCFGFEYSDTLMGEGIYDPENDFPAVFYFCGYVGFTLYMLFFAGIAWVVLSALVRRILHALRHRKRPGLGGLLGAVGQGFTRFMTIRMGAVGMTFLLAVIAAELSGNVLRRPNVTAYFAAVAAELVVLCREPRPRPPEEELF